MNLSQDTDLIWGAWRARQSNETRDEAGYARMAQAALDLGIQWLDHADIYDDGEVEALHGRAMAALSPADRNAFSIITKCGVRFPSPGQPGVRVAHYRSDAAFVRTQADASLKRLGIEQIGLYLLHRPDYLMRAEETARALEDLHQAGKVAAIGVSNFSTHQFARLEAALDLPLIAHQIEISVSETSALDDGRMDLACTGDTTLLAWSPLAGGRLFSESAHDAGLQQCLGRVSEAHGDCGTDVVALSWLKSLPARTIPILGTCSTERLIRQARGYRATDLDCQDWYSILQASRGEPIP